MKNTEHPLHIAPEREIKINAGNTGEYHYKEKSAESKPDIVFFRPIFRVFDYKSDPENK